MKLEKVHLFLTLIREDIAKLELRLEGVQRLAAQLATDGGDSSMMTTGLKKAAAEIAEDVETLCKMIEESN